MNKKDIFLDYKSLIKSSLIDVIKHALKKLQNMVFQMVIIFI